MNKHDIRTNNPLLLSIPALCLIIVGMIVNVIERRATNYFPVRYPLDETLSDTIFMNVYSVIVFVMISLIFLTFIIKKYGAKIIYQTSPFIFIFIFSITLSIISIPQDFLYNGEFLRIGIGVIHIPSLLCFGYIFITAYLCSHFIDDVKLSEFYPLLLLALSFGSVLICCRTHSKSYALIVILSFISSIVILIKNKSIHKRQVLSILYGTILIISSCFLTFFIVDKLCPELNAQNKIIEVLLEKREESDFTPAISEYIHIFREALKHIRLIGTSEYDIVSVPSTLYFAFVGKTGLETILFGSGWIPLFFVMIGEMSINFILFSIAVKAEEIYQKTFITAVALSFLARTVIAVIITFVPEAYLDFSCPPLPFMGGYTSVLYDSVLFVVSLLLSTTYSCSKTGRIIVVNEKLKTRIINWINADDLNDE